MVVKVFTVDEVRAAIRSKVARSLAVMHLRNRATGLSLHCPRFIADLLFLSDETPSLR
jgi:hypothetical protein